MTYDYSRIQKAAKKLIDKFGGLVTIVAKSTIPNPQGWKPGTSSTSQTDVKGVFTDYEEKFIDGTVIKRGDKKVLIYALGVKFPPDMTGTLTTKGGIKWNIIKVEPICPGDTVIIWKVQVRQ